MVDLNRRYLLTALGQSAALIGLSAFTARDLAWPEAAVRGAAPDEWEYYFPNRYDAQDQKVLNAFHARLESVNNYGPINIADVVNGRLTGVPPLSWNPYEFGYKVTRENVDDHARMYTNNNPLFADAAYPGATSGGARIAFPLVLTLEAMPAMPKKEGIGDYMVVTSHNDTIAFFEPIREGDTLYTLYQQQHCVDITPSTGSRYRTFVMSGWARTYNQSGELVAEGANILKESFHRHSDPAKRNPDGAHAWESPDWWHQRPMHIYTDADWDRIRKLWSREHRRGAVPLYWEDVKVGDMPTPTAVGPIISDVETDMMFHVPPMSTAIRANVLNPETFARMVKNPQGIYVMPEFLEKKPHPSAFSGAGKDSRIVRTPEIAHTDGRATLQNAVSGKCAAGMLYNWMGDAGWLKRIGWDIMPAPPGYPEAVIPSITKDMMPAQFDKFPYLVKVPALTGLRAIYHPLEGDLIISNAYVTDKYVSGIEHLVDLTWWSETLDGYIVEEGFATVRLPGRT